MCTCGQVIVYPTQDSVKRFGALISLLSVWTVSLLLASPLAVFNVLDPFEPFESIVLYETCVENLDLGPQRRAYSLASIVFQYLLPVVTVSVKYLLPVVTVSVQYLLPVVTSIYFRSSPCPSSIYFRSSPSPSLTPVSATSCAAEW